MEQLTDKQKNEILFMQFVMGLSQSGMMQLGKIMNPITQKIEKDLNAAQATIDLLIAIREKTKGNLSNAEEELLTNTISTLQLNYVDELEASKQEKQEDKVEQKSDDETENDKEQQDEDKNQKEK